MSCRNISVYISKTTTPCWKSLQPEWELAKKLTLAKQVTKGEGNATVIMRALWANTEVIRSERRVISPLGPLHLSSHNTYQGSASNNDWLKGAGWQSTLSVTSTQNSSCCYSRWAQKDCTRSKSKTSCRTHTQYEGCKTSSSHYNLMTQQPPRTTAVLLDEHNVSCS